jgi:hypothetical protein
VKACRTFLISLAIAAMVIYGAGTALAGNSDMPAASGNAQSGSGSQQSGSQGAPQSRPNDSGNQYGNAGTPNSGQESYGNMPRMNFSGQSYREWQRWASEYRAGPKYPYMFNFSYADELAGKNASMNGPKWFNESWGSSHSVMSKKTARLRITTLLHEMNMLRAMINESGLSAEERAALTMGMDINARWLNETDKEIQAAGNMKSLGQAIAKAEPSIAMIRSEVKANAGLLACKNMDARIDMAMNASDMVNERIQTREDKAWFTSSLAAYDQHIYNACQYEANAREAFQRYSDTRDDANYAEGVRQMELAQDELKRAFDNLSEIFSRMSHINREL